MRQFIRTLIFGDWLLKIFSFTLATLTWLAVSFSQRQKPVDVHGRPDLSGNKFRDVPVLVVSGSADVHELKVSPSEVDLVTLQGERTIMDNLERKHIHIQIDLTGITITNGMKRRVDVITPPGVTCMSVDPEEVEIILPPAAESKPETTNSR